MHIHCIFKNSQSVIVGDIQTLKMKEGKKESKNDHSVHMGLLGSKATSLVSIGVTKVSSVMTIARSSA